MTRIVVKLSGEACAGTAGYGIDARVIHQLARQIGELQAHKVELGIVIGGGNIFRGTGVTANRHGIDRTTGDTMGMLATVINSLALQDALEKNGLSTRVLSAIPMEKVAEPFIRRRALRHLEKGRVVIFAGGTGNPYFSTDTAAVLRAIEINASLLMKATNVDGVYAADPQTQPTAERFAKLTMTEALDKQLAVMDATGLTLAREHHLPIRIFKLLDMATIFEVWQNTELGTYLLPE